MDRRAGITWRLAVALLAVPALLVATAAGASGESPPRRTVSLMWVDVSRTVPFALPDAAREVQSLLGAAGLEVIWRQVPPGAVTSGDELRVILLNSDASGMTGGRRVMGAALDQASSPRAVWLYVPNVARALGLEAASIPLWSGLQRRELTIALARVAAHELVHLVAPDLPHASSGLMAATLNRSELLNPRLQIDRGTRMALLARVEASHPGPPTEWASTIP